MHCMLVSILVRQRSGEDIAYMQHKHFMSFYATHNRQFSNSVITPEGVFDKTKNGELASIINKIRSGKEKKSVLPCFTPSGKFFKRAINGLESHSGIYVIDIDGKDNLPEDIVSARDLLQNSENVYLLFTSPSGDGLKILVKTKDPYPKDNDAHVSIYNDTILSWLNETCPSIKIDSSGKDVSRLCYLSSDSGAHYNSDPKPLVQLVKKTVIDSRKFTHRMANASKELRQGLINNIENYTMVESDKGKWVGACPRFVVSGTCDRKNDGFVIYADGSFSCRGCITSDMEYSLRQKHRHEVEDIAYSPSKVPDNPYVENRRITTICRNVKDGIVSLVNKENIIGYFLVYVDGNNFRYTEGIGYLKWTGSRWKKLDDEGDLMNLIDDVGISLRNIFLDEKAAVDESIASLQQELSGSNDDNQKLLLIKDIENASTIQKRLNFLIWKVAADCGSLSTKRNVLTGSYKTKPNIQENPQVWNSRDRRLIIFPNGTYEVDTAAFRPSSRNDYMTNSISNLYDPSATCPVFDKALATSLPDDDIRNFFLRFMGYSITGTMEQQCILLNVGNGANGKTVIMEAIADSLGSEYAITHESNLLIQRHGDDPHPTELHDLHGMRLVYMDEMPANGRFDEKKLKRLSGGGKIRARKLYHNAIQFDTTHTMVISSNHTPTILGTDIGVWRRIYLLKWQVCIPENEQDSTLSSKLRQEGSGIINRLLEGLEDYKARGNRLDPPLPIQEFTSNYRSDEDIVGNWLSDPDFVELGEDYTCKSRDAAVSIANYYNTFNIRTAIPTGSVLKKDLLDRGFVHERNSQSRYYKGFRCTIRSNTG